MAKLCMCWGWLEQIVAKADVECEMCTEVLRD